MESYETNGADISHLPNKTGGRQSVPVGYAICAFNGD